MIEPAHLSMTRWPLRPELGMQTGEIPDGIRIEHIPTGTVVVCDECRSQAGNIKLAMAILTAKLESLP